MWEKRIIWFVMKWLERRLGLWLWRYVPAMQRIWASSCRIFNSEILSIQPDYFRKFTVVAKGMLDLRRCRRLAGMLLKQFDQEMGGFWEVWGEGTVREFGVSIYTLLYLKWITNRGLLYNSGNSAQCYVAAWRGAEFGGEWIHADVWQSLSCPPESITTLLVC